MLLKHRYHYGISAAEGGQAVFHLAYLTALLFVDPNEDIAEWLFWVHAGLTGFQNGLYSLATYKESYNNHASRQMRHYLSNGYRLHIVFGLLSSFIQLYFLLFSQLTLSYRNISFPLVSQIEQVGHQLNYLVLSVYLFIKLTCQLSQNKASRRRAGSKIASKKSSLHVSHEPKTKQRNKNLNRFYFFNVIRTALLVQTIGLTAGQLLYLCESSLFETSIALNSGWMTLSVIVGVLLCRSRFTAVKPQGVVKAPQRAAAHVKVQSQGVKAPQRAAVHVKVQINRVVPMSEGAKPIVHQPR